MSDSTQRTQLIQSVVDFTGVSPSRAEALLKECNWNVPEAVTRFFQQSEPAAAYAAPVGGFRLLVKSILEALKSCMGWSWHLVRMFLFGPTTVKSGTGNFKEYFTHLAGSSKPTCFEGSFKDACTLSRTRDKRKVMIVFLHTQSSPDFNHSVESVLLDESVVSMINAQFIFWAGDIDYMQPQQLLRALPLRVTPLLVAITSQNATEIRIVGACGGSGFSLEAALGVLQKAQEEQDRLMAEDEQFKINRSLRETQDREYEEALQRDREEEERIRLLSQAEEEEERKRNEEKKRVENRLVAITEKWCTSEKELASHLVVKLPNGKRLDEKFKRDMKIETVFEWVACQIDSSDFSLSTSYPCIKLEPSDQRSLSDLELVPNGVMLCSFIDKD